MPKRLFDRYRARVARGELALDVAQEAAAKRLEALAMALKNYVPRRRRFFRAPPTPPRGIYLWGDVGRGKSMLMDIFFAAAPLAPKRRVHFNAFMTETHARIHEWRSLDASARAKRPEFVREGGDDPLPPVARAIAAKASLLCFDEFQVGDVADAMILGRLFEQLFALGIVVVATSNMPPTRLYEGGLNRQLFMPFVAILEQRLDVVELDGRRDYRLGRMAGLDLYLSPLGPEADAAMDAVWQKLTHRREGESETLAVLGRTLTVPQASAGVARFGFDELCARPLAAADYLAIARRFHTVLIDRIPAFGFELRNEARRFVVLIDTLYDEGVTLVCSAAAPPSALYVESEGDSAAGAEAFRRTASRLAEMQSRGYLKRAHGARVGG